MLTIFTFCITPATQVAISRSVDDMENVKRNKLIDTPAVARAMLNRLPSQESEKYIAKTGPHNGIAEAMK
jgi:hypothetical protein